MLTAWQGHHGVHGRTCKTVVVIVLPTTIVGRIERVFSTPVDDGIVLLNPDRDKFIGLEQVGLVVWELLATPCTVSEICRALGERFDATQDQIEADVSAFIAEMLDEGVVRVIGP
jgi:coenzyme PQQ synthesis protein D (PqqD)